VKDLTGKRKEWSGFGFEVLERLGASGQVYLVCTCPVGSFTRESRVDVLRKRVQCVKCRGWLPVEAVGVDEDYTY